MAASMTTVQRLRVGVWQVEPDRDRVRGPSGEVQLMPKAMAVLVYLAERPGQVVSTDELVEAVWRGRPMGDNPVYKCITQLRTVLGDDRKSPSFIETVHTKGYRLIAPVVWGDTGESAERAALTDGESAPAHRRGIRHPLLWASALAAISLVVAYVFFSRDIAGGREGEADRPDMAGPPSIAVLPFVNMSPDPGQDYFADGLTEELITQLANLRGLRVIGRTSSFAFKGKNEDLRTVGRTLGVNHVLKGGVRKTDERVRVTVQLIDPADGTHLWSDVYDRSLEDLFILQEEIAKTVASALHISISARIVTHGGTRKMEAYDAFLTGLAAAAAGGADNVLSSIASFERAVAIDPEFLAAWEALAGAFQLASIDIPERQPEWSEKLAGAENKMSALAPHSPTVTILSAQREMSGGNLIEAERLFTSHTGILPRYRSLYLPYGVFLLNVGRPRDAIAQFTRDQQAEPLALGPSLWLQVAYEVAGDLETADMEYQRAIGFLDDTRAIRTMALVRAMARRDEQTIRRELTAQIAVSRLTRPINGAMLRTFDDPPAALAEIRRHLDDPASMNSAVVLMMISAWAAYFGDAELALRAIEKLPPFAGGTFIWALWRPLTLEMRNLSRFKALVRERGLYDYWRASGNWGDFCRPVGMDDFDCAPDSPGG